MKSLSREKNLKGSKAKAVQILVGVFALLTSVVTPAQAANGIDLDFAASYYLSYDHSVGGGAWDNRVVNKDIENSLEGSEFACGDIVSFLSKLNIDNTAAMQNNGKMTVAIDYLFDADTTGQSGLAYTQFENVVINRGTIVDLVYGEDSTDSAMLEGTSAASTAVLSLEVRPPAPFTKDAALTGTVTVDDLEAGETVIIRTDVKIECQAGAKPTGNILARVKNLRITKTNGTTTLNPPTQIGSGEQTVPMQRVGGILEPNLLISKTAYKGATGSCPGVDFNEIKPSGSVTYCYEVSNNSDVINPPGAPIYNVSLISDDNGTPANLLDDFTVVLSGLTDQDADGLLDDLAAGATASASYFRQFNGEKNTTVINTAVVSGFTASTGGTQLTASDTTEVFIDPPIVTIDIDKKTNGADGLYILEGSGVNFTYDITNTGDVTLSSIDVNDSDTALVINCPKTTLAPAETMQCTATGTWQAGSYSNTGDVSGVNGTDTATDTDTSSYFGADPKISITKTPDTQTVIEGNTANFSIAVTNTGNVALTGVAVTDALAPGCDKAIGAMAVSDVNSYTCSLTNVTAGFINTAVASGNYETTTVTSSDTATVVVDFLPKINVTKTPNLTSVPETGANVTFTFVVTNEAVEAFTLESLSDDMLGDLDDQGTCSVPQTIAAGGSYSCAVTKKIGSDSLTPHVNIVTAGGKDPEGNTTSDTATATVNFTDVLPDITLTKTANPTVLMLPGGFVTYTLKITNSGTETVTVGSISDPQLTLSAQCLALVGQLIAPSAYLTCLIEGVNVTSTTGLPFTNTATATAYDNEDNVDTATATATVTFDWYGRSPGYWKNHPTQWPAPYAPANTIATVFFDGNVPSFLKTGEILNLNNIGGTDTLADGLAYKGGTDIKGAAQILLRAAVAALLNEKYYGTDYPGSDSPENLILLVRNTMSVNNRSAYLGLASILDKWNNGIHSSM